MSVGVSSNRFNHSGVVPHHVVNHDHPASTDLPGPVDDVRTTEIELVVAVNMNEVEASVLDSRKRFSARRLPEANVERGKVLHRLAIIASQPLTSTPRVNADQMKIRIRLAPNQRRLAASNSDLRSKTTAHIAQQETERLPPRVPARSAERPSEDRKILQRPTAELEVLPQAILERGRFYGPWLWSSLRYSCWN